MRRPATFDTGGPDDIYRGALVTWHHTPRGGYGFTLAIPATVVVSGRKVVRIETTTAAGATVTRNVRIEKLTWRSGSK